MFGIARAAPSPAHTAGNLTVPPHFTAISLSAAAVCITFALLLRWKGLSRLEFLKPWLYLLAGIGFAAAFLTNWANTITGWARTVPYVGSAIPIIIAVVLGYIVLYDLWPKHTSSTITEWSALLLPSFTSAMGGAAGSMFATAFGTVAVVGGNILGQAFGV